MKKPWEETWGAVGACVFVELEIDGEPFSKNVGQFFSYSAEGANGREDAAARARLAAAAPELYRALEAAHSELASLDGSGLLSVDGADALLKARAALAKARGE